MKKKVLFTATVDSHIKNFHLPYLKYFKDNDYEVHVATNGKDKIPNCDKKHTVSFERSPFRLNNINARKQLKNIIDKEGYEIIHTHTPMGSVITRLAALKARKIYKTRVIYTAHGFHFYKGAPLQNWLLYYPVEKFLARYTDTLITINKEDYKRAKKKFNTSVKYVPGVGVDEKKFNFKMTKNEKSELRKSIGLKDSDYVLIYVAELNKNKNQTMLIDAMSEIIKEKKDVHLLLVGIDSYKGKHKKHVAKLGLESNVHFLGFRNDVPRLLKVSDLAVSTSLREGLPLNLVEAHFSELPAIATGCRGNRDVAGVHIVNEVSASGFAGKINNSMKKPLKSLKYEKKLDEFKIEKILDRVIKIYGAGAFHDDINNPIRILHVVTKMDRGGLETMLMNYYRNIDRSKIQFDFLVHRKEKGAYDDEIKSLGGKIFKLSPISLKNLLRYRIELMLFFLNNKEYKIVHSHLDSLSALPLLAAKKANVPVRIAHSHTSNFDNDYKEKIRVVTKKIIKYFATDFAGCSEEAIEFMFGKNVYDYKVINNAIEIDKFRFNPIKRKEVRNNLSISEATFVLGHVGRFNYPKNHSYLIDLYYEFYNINKDSLLLLIGDGEDLDIIQNKVKALGLDGNVVFLGSRRDVHELMQAMDIFVMPSKYEGIPVVSIEAQASGLPCFFSDLISDKVSISNCCHFIGIDKKPKEWASKINSKKSVAREDQSVAIKNRGYDILSESCSLQKFYLLKVGSL
jgi:glycosyltransferase involved in cell wall biosynthesis